MEPGRPKAVYRGIPRNPGFRFVPALRAFWAVFGLYCQSAQAQAGNRPQGASGASGKARKDRARRVQGLDGLRPGGGFGPLWQDSDQIFGPAAKSVQKVCQVAGPKIFKKSLQKVLTAFLKVGSNALTELIHRQENDMSVLKDMIADYQEERMECVEVIAMLEEKLAMYRNRIIEIDAITNDLKTNRDPFRT